MIFRFAIGLALLLAWAGPAAAGQFWTPERNSAERRAIMDAAREPIEREIGQPVIFKVEDLRVTDGWAFLHAVPQRPDGAPIDYSATRYQEWIESGTFGGSAAVLMARDGGGWRVVTWALGFTDVIWDTWDEEHGAPAWLWP